MIVALVLSILFGVGAIGAGASETAPAKKRCHIVKKKVRGTIKRVRVCTKPKPRRVKNVSLALAGGKSVSSTVGSSGGKVATGGLALEIPANALAAETVITLTPVTAVRGLPAGMKAQNGVQLGPENLALLKPAVLTIRSPKGARAIAWFGKGRDVSRYPSGRAGPNLVVRVGHFSGVAAATGPAAAWSAVPSPVSALRSRFATAVKPGLAAAASQDPLESGAFESAFAWEREVELLGLGDEFAAEKSQIRDALATALGAAVARAETACKHGHDLTQLERLTRLDRVAQLWGIEVPGGSGFERAVECAHFELDMELEMTEDQTIHEVGGCTEDTSLHWELGTKVVRLEIAPAEGLRLEGEKSLEVTKYQYHHVFTTVCSPDPPATCTFTGVEASPARPLHIALEIDPAAVANGPPEIVLTVSPAGVTQTYTASGTYCSGTNTSALTDVPIVFPGDVGIPGSTSFRIPLTGRGQFVGGDVYAIWPPETFSGNAPGNISYTAIRSFVLRHTPEP